MNGKKLVLGVGNEILMDDGIGPRVVETLHLSNLHDVNFLSAVELGKRMGYSIPEAIHIFAIEILEDQVFGEEFTPPLQERFEAIIDEIHTGIQATLKK